MCFSFISEYKKARSEIKKASTDTVKLQKKVKKGTYFLIKTESDKNPRQLKGKDSPSITEFGVWSFSVLFMTNDILKIQNEGVSPGGS